MVCVVKSKSDSSMSGNRLEFGRILCWTSNSPYHDSIRRLLPHYDPLRTSPTYMVYPGGGSWDSSRLHGGPEDHLDLVLSTTKERKVRTTEELEAAMNEPMKVAPTRNVWIHESLEDEARRVWEAGR